MTITLLITATYFLFRLVSGPVLEAGLTSLLLLVLLVLLVRWTGDGSWSNSLKWPVHYPVRFGLMLLASVLNVALVMAPSGRSGWQLVADAILTLVAFWTFAAGGARFSKRAQRQ